MTSFWSAYLALGIWPIFSLWLYATRSVSRATVWTILGGMLLLPVGVEIKMQMIPALDKWSIPALAAAVGCLWKAAPRTRARFGIIDFLVVVYVSSPLITSSLNTDSFSAGPRFLPGETLYDGISACAAQFLTILPFLLARRVLKSPNDCREILRALVLSGLAYSLLMIFELRMSPQLNNMIYGYFPSDWIQEYRNGLFRPVVFLGHGLGVASFTMSAFVAAASFWRTNARVMKWTSPSIVTAYLGLLLALCQTLSSLLYGITLAPLVKWFSPRAQARIATVFVCLALSYPLLRTIDWVPTQTMLDAARMVSPERESSLKVRFDSEQILLEHAHQRLWFGWGRWGRNRVYGSDGQQLAVTDGKWIITVGSFGLIGFIAEFGLLAFAVLKVSSAVRYLSAGEAPFVSTVSLLVAVSVIDLIPNAGLTPWVWLMAGAILGRAEAAIALVKRDIFGRQLVTNPAT